MDMQADPCRQAATEIMEDISMETGMDDEAYRQDMINIFPGHPALPQQTHNLQGDLLLNLPRTPGVPGDVARFRVVARIGDMRAPVVRDVAVAIEGVGQP